VPSSLALLGGALVGQLGRPRRVLGAVLEGAGVAGRAVLPRRAARSGGAGIFDAPRTSFNRALTPHRSVAYARAPLADFKAVARAHRAKVNDVVLAACTSALRAHLKARDELPEEPLVASVPIAMPTRSQRVEGGNRISMMLVPLPTHIDDPRDRLHALREATQRAKREQGGSGGGVVQRVTDFATALATPGLLSGLMELYSSSHVADHLPPIWNVVVSNIAGSPVPLYCAGARIEAIYPMGPVMDGVGLNFTFLSTAGDMNVGIMACRELVEDVEALADRVVAGLEELLATVDSSEESRPVASA
jgi:WS/DGAT/MGAT family acyltransferase